MSKQINNGFISSSQISKLLFHFSLGSSSLIMPTIVAIISKQDVWLTYLFSLPISFAFLWIYFALADRFPTRTLVQYAEMILGSWLGKLVAFSYLLFFLILSALVLRNITDFFGMYFLPRTPPWFTGITFMIVIVYGVCLGIETIGRTGEMLYLWGLLLIGATMMMTLHQVRLENFEPVLYHGWLRPIRGLYPMIGLPTAEYVFLSIILPSVKEDDRSKLKKSVYRAMTFSGVLNLLTCVLVLGLLGVYEMERSPFAVIDMVKSIRFQESSLRIEVLAAIIWVSTAFIKMLLCLYVLSLLTTQMLRLKDYRMVVIPYATLIIPLSLVVYHNNSMDVQRFSTGTYMPYSLLHGLLLPVILLIVAILASKRESDNNLSKSREGQSPT